MADAARIEVARERVLAALTVLLAERHGCGDERFWRILLGPWVLLWVPSVAERVARVRAALDAGAVSEGDRTFPRSQLPPVDTASAVAAMKDADRFCARIDACTLAVLEGRSLPAAPEGTAWSAAAVPFRRAVLSAALDAVQATRGGRCVRHRASYLPPDVAGRLARSTRGALLPLGLPAFVLTAAPCEPAERELLGTCDLGDDDLGRVLAALLPLDLPAVFLEAFDRLAAFVDRYGGRPPRAILSANAWYFDEPFKLWAAQCAAAGTQLLGVQHGGNYGIDAVLPGQDHETAVTDRYYSWGWSGATSRADVQPMPPVKLVGRTAEPASARHDGVLYVCTVYAQGLVAFPKAAAQFDDYLDRHRRFASALAPEIAEVLRVRPHAEDSGWGVADRWRALLPGVEIESWSAPFPASVARCRLLVIDHLSTTFAEAIALDRPVVLHWSPVNAPVGQRAAETIQAFRDARILFDDPAEAAAETAVAYADVEAWWAAPARRAAVAAFRDRFASVGPDALSRWRAEVGERAGA